MNPHTSDTARQVDPQVRRLFEQHTIAELRDTEVKTRQDISEKRTELRSLVGTRYRDLIDSADSVLAMRDASAEICKRFENIQSQCKKILKAVRNTNPEDISSFESDSESTSSDVVNFAGHIKLLVDAPEQIWSAMETMDYLRATSLYVHAERIHHALNTEVAWASLLNSIPLLSRQWSLISHFPVEIKQQALSQLQQPNAHPKVYAGCLCSMILLDRSSPLHALKLYLDSRKQLLSSLLSTSIPISESLDSGLICVYKTLYHLGHIFSPTYTAHVEPPHKPLLWQLLETLSDSSDTSGDDGIRLTLWQHQQDPIDSKEVVDLTVEWMQTAAEMVKRSAKDRLSGIQKAKQLAQVLRDLQDTSKTQAEDWGLVCDWVLGGTSTDLWDLLLEEAGIEAAEAVIDRGLQTLNLGPLLSDEKAKELAGFSTGESVMEIADKWRIEFEKQLEAILRDFGHITPKFAESRVLAAQYLLNIFVDSEDTNRHTKPNSADRCLFKSPDLLVSQIRSACASKLLQLLKHLESRVSDLPKSTSEQRAIAIVQGLLVGQVAYGLSKQSKVLPLVFLEESVVRNRQQSGLERRLETLRSKRRLSNTSDKYAKEWTQVCKEYRVCFLNTHMEWASWLSLELSQSLKQAVSTENWQNKDRSASWQAISLNPEKDQKVQLPPHPSPYIMHFLFSVCQHIRKICGHRTQTSVIAYLSCCLLEIATDTYLEQLNNTDTNPCKEAAVQMMLDLEIICQILKTGYEVLSAEKKSEMTNSLIETLKQRQDTKSIEKGIQTADKVKRRLQTALDPIDVAFYTQHLNTHAKVCLGHYSALLGFLVNLGHSQAKTKPSRPYAGEHHNSLRLANQTARFRYLPVSQLPAYTRPKIVQMGAPDYTQAHQGSLVSVQSSGNNNASVARVANEPVHRKSWWGW